MGSSQTTADGCSFARLGRHHNQRIASSEAYTSYGKCLESNENSDVGSTNKLFKSFKILALEGTRALSDAVLERMMVSTFRPFTRNSQCFRERTIYRIICL